MCPAAMLAPRMEGNGDEPMCLDCADGRACVALRCAGQVREESSVTVQAGIFGGVEFVGEGESVVHRTPEELGIARTVPDVPERKTVSLNWNDGAVRGSMRSAGVKRDHKQTMRTVVTRSALQTEVTKESEVKNGGVKCAFEGCNEMAYDGRKYCAGRHGYKNKPAPTKRAAKSRAMLPRPVEVDPQRPGTATALMTALNKIDADNERIKIEIELTRAEVDQMFGRLSPSQRQAFLTAGLRASLLA
jgi:hypothetical protein